MDIIHYQKEKVFEKSEDSFVPYNVNNTEWWTCSKFI